MALYGPDHQASHDPLGALGERYWPVPKPIASIEDVWEHCRRLDEVANIGAGAPRP